jgi:hypothetical protein
LSKFVILFVAACVPPHAPTLRLPQTPASKRLGKLVQVVAVTPPLREIVRPGRSAVCSKVSIVKPVIPKAASITDVFALKSDAGKKLRMIAACAPGAARSPASVTATNVVFASRIEHLHVRFVMWPALTPGHRDSS